jgi:hypothetical protein
MLYIEEGVLIQSKIEIVETVNVKIYQKASNAQQTEKGLGQYP